jgi:hypothetical protein
LVLLFDLIAVDREVNCGITDMTAGLNKRSELDIKNYEIAILAAVAINGDLVDSTETDFKIDVIKILMIFIFIRSVDICQIS